MPKFLIERNMPGAAGLSDQEFQEAAEKSCATLREMGPDIQWVESYVSDDKIYCVYIAENEKMIREHGSKAGFPVDSIAKVSRMIDPTTAEQSSQWTAKKSSAEQTLRQ